MADYPLNMDDGELWVPSEILRKERYYPEFPSELTYMEELAHQLSAYALLERKQQHQQIRPKPPPSMLLPANLECRSRGGRFGSGVHPPQPGSGIGLGFHHGGGGLGCGGGGYDLCLLESGSHLGSRPVYQHHYHATKPVHNTQVESVVQARAAILQRQHQLQNRGLNRLLPVQANRSWFGRESGGTGVFLPRVANNNETPTRKKQNVRNGDETKQRAGLVKKAGVGRKDQVPVAAAAAAEMGLPSDWTY